MLDFKVSPDGGTPYRLTADSRDIVRWEQAGGGRSFGKFEQNATMVWIVEIAYFAAVRQGLHEGDRKTFTETVAVRLVGQTPDEDSAEDPTQPAP